MSNYKKTKKIWTKWRKKNPSYASATNSDKHIKKSKMIVDRYSGLLNSCASFSELGVGNGRNIHFFHEKFPDWHYYGNDIYPDIHNIIRAIYPDLLDYAEIIIEDTLIFLTVCNNTDIMFTHGHLMHLPDDVIGEVCSLISDKTDRFILLYEAYPHRPGTKVKSSYKDYRYERDYENMFDGFVLKDKQIEEHPTKEGIRHCLYLFENKVD